MEMKRMRRSADWMRGYSDYYNNRPYPNYAGMDRVEWMLGYSYAMNEEEESMAHEEGE